METYRAFCLDCSNEVHGPVMAFDDNPPWEVGLTNESTECEQCGTTCNLMDPDLWEASPEEPTRHYIMECRADDCGLSRGFDEEENAAQEFADEHHEETGHPVLVREFRLSGGRGDHG